MQRLMSWSVAWLAALQVSAAQAQGNIDAGKTPAQIFGDTCSACHRSARDLRRTSASFLRSHYTAGSDEANAMAGYLAGLGGGEPRPAQPKRPPADIAKQPPRQPTEQPRSAQGQPKARPSASAQARAVAEERPTPEPPPPPPSMPVLEAFEE